MAAILVSLAMKPSLTDTPTEMFISQIEFCVPSAWRKKVRIAFHFVAVKIMEERGYDVESDRWTRLITTCLTSITTSAATSVTTPAPTSGGSQTVAYANGHETVSLAVIGPSLWSMLADRWFDAETGVTSQFSLAFATGVHLQQTIHY